MTKSSQCVNYVIFCCHNIFVTKLWLCQKFDFFSYFLCSQYIFMTKLWLCHVIAFLSTVDCVSLFQTITFWWQSSNFVIIFFIIKTFSRQSYNFVMLLLFSPNDIILGKEISLLNQSRSRQSHYFVIEMYGNKNIYISCDFVTKMLW